MKEATQASLRDSQWFPMVIMCINMAKKYPKLDNPFDNIQQKFDSNL
jgi:hypothetical protein